MPHVDTPWIGLAALLAMFVIPLLPSWLFEGPRTVKHRPSRHVCADCGGPWTDGHACAEDDVEIGQPLRGELRRSGSTPVEARSVRRPKPLTSGRHAE